MIDAFKVYIDRLKNGEVQRIEGSFAPSFLEVEEAELRFEKPVVVRGEAYVADEHLVIHLKASTFAKMPCAICNEMFDHPLTVGNFYATESLTDIPSAIFDFGTPLREALLTELPHTAECTGGKCRSRESIAPYLRSEKRVEKTTYFPFADIDPKL